MPRRPDPPLRKGPHPVLIAMVIAVPLVLALLVANLTRRGGRDRLLHRLQDIGAQTFGTPAGH
ncbi:MAG TPA: hypothetical protein VEI97_17935 [bacterium]|nr:hypothetical protein [bacterium]